MSQILHITPRPDWEAAQQAGNYRSQSLLTQGFIHCSTAEQVIPVANFVFRGQPDLLLLVIDTDKVQPEVKFEPPIDPHTGKVEADKSDLYPHVYGSLNLDAVINVVAFPPNPDGTFTLPPEIEGQL